MVKFRLGLVDGRGPEVYSHDRCRLVGRLDRSSPGCSQCAGLVGCAEGVAGGRGPMSTPAGRDVGGSSVGGKVRRSRGHGLVAVAARVRQTETDRRGKETKRAHKRGHKKKKR